MSLDAYNGLKQSGAPLLNSDKELFSLLLPVYLDREHFRRSLPQIQSVLLRLAPHGWQGGFRPSLALHAIPRAINTLTVLLSDGAAAPERLLTTFSFLHRLLLALAEAYPELEQEAE